MIPGICLSENGGLGDNCPAERKAESEDKTSGPRVLGKGRQVLSSAVIANDEVALTKRSSARGIRAQESKLYAPRDSKRADSCRRKIHRPHHGRFLAPNPQISG